ncbi:MAG TPA: ABC transporter ATP-binding protein [Flavisolibacter sp.]|nr:ABC transporter ATP-binding protein [Flavisolibacter sp.]
MIETFNERLAEVASYFNHGDYHLGYRRLLDAAIETNDFTVYEKTLAFCDWYDNHGGQERDKAVINEKVKDLLSVIGQGYRTPAAGQYEVKLSAESVSKKYSRGSFSLSSVDVALRPSEIIGLVGENGNGKTTFLRLLYGELQPDTGIIKYHFKNNPASSSFYDIKTRIAFIPQRPAAWYGLLMDNLQFASTYAGLKGKENYLWTEMIIARMGLRPFRSYTWSRISSGYKMRFELARTLIRKPEILLLDEPLANLDILAQQIILEDLRFLARSYSMPLSVILSSQQLYEVEKVSDQVIFLQKGIAKYQHTGEKEEAAPAPLIIELETSASREQLQQVINPLGLEKLSFNGGVYILYFTGGTQMGSVLSAIGQGGLPVKYLRDISVSSRRFFDA